MIFANHLGDWMRLPRDEITNASVAQRHRAMARAPSAGNHTFCYFRPVWADHGLVFCSSWGGSVPTRETGGLKRSRFTDELIVAPGKTMQIGFVESITGRFRDELLNDTLFPTLAEARMMIASGTEDGRPQRPPWSLGHLTPQEIVVKPRPETNAACDQLQPARSPYRGRRIKPQIIGDTSLRAPFAERRSCFQPGAAGGSALPVVHLDGHASCVHCR